MCECVCGMCSVCIYGICVYVDVRYVWCICGVCVCLHVCIGHMCICRCVICGYVYSVSMSVCMYVCGIYGVCSVYGWVHDNGVVWYLCI